MKTIKTTLLATLLFLTTIAFSQNMARSYSSAMNYTYAPEQDIFTEYHIHNLSYILGDEPVHSGVRTTHDGSKMYFFTDHPVDYVTPNNQDIKVAIPCEVNSWKPAGHVDDLNNLSHNGVHSVLDNGNKLLLLSEYQQNNTSIDGLSITEFNEKTGKWSFPKPLEIQGFKNEASTSFFMSPNYDALLLALENNQSYGEQDMYVSFPKANGKWTKPINMGSVLNTGGSEGTMFMDQDGKTLYFATNGRADSYGGYDIYKSTRLDETWENWSEPENLGRPFNSELNDLYYWIDNTTGTSYLSRSYLDSNEAHHSDIIRIEKKNLMPKLTVNIFEQGTNKKITDAEVSLTTATNSYTLEPGSTFKVASFEEVNSFVVEVEKESYISYAENMTFDWNEELNHSINVYLAPELVNTPIELTDVFFEFDTDILVNESVPSLEHVKEVLLKEPGLIMEIAGHTDVRGDTYYNHQLSQKRAQAIIDYLVNAGVQEHRLHAIGYGEDFIRNHCEENVPCTEEEHLHNRRVEFQFLNRLP